MKRVSSAFVALALAAGASGVQAADLAAGRAVFEKLNCASCHGADAKTSVDPAYPILAGQHADYLAHALKAYQRGAAGATVANSRKNPIMGAFAVQLSVKDIQDVSAWLASLPSDLAVRQ